MLYPFGFYLDPTMLLLIPGILIAAWAQYKVSHTYNVYAQYRSMGGWSAAAKARRILEINPQHELFGKLTAVHDQGKDSQSFKDYCNLLYDQALLLEGIMPDDPVAFANKVASLMAK